MKVTQIGFFGEVKKSELGHSDCCEKHKYQQKSRFGSRGPKLVRKVVNTKMGEHCCVGGERGASEKTGAS